MPSLPDQPLKFASRGGFKLHHALTQFGLDPTGSECADLGCSVGGFTDCWLQHGAVKVYAVDTAYGELAWTLRNDDRVRVMERTNALHAEPPERVRFVSLDLSWTRQARAIPAALRWLTDDPAQPGTVVSLIKPHYECTKDELRAHATKGVLPEAFAREVTERVVASLPELGVRVVGLTQSPITGGSKRAKGNHEWLVACERA